MIKRPVIKKALLMAPNNTQHVETWQCPDLSSNRKPTCSGWRRVTPRPASIAWKSTGFASCSAATCALVCRRSVRLIVRRAKWSPHLIRPLLTKFPWSSSRLRSSSRMSWREKSLEARVIRRCFHLRSLPSPKSECSRIMTEWFQQLLFLWHLKVKTHVQLSYRYYANTETYLKAVALKRMPPNLQTVDMLKAGTFILLFILPSS